MAWYDAAAFTGIITVTASVATLALSQRHSRSIAVEDRSHAASSAREDRLFQAREARYAERLQAVIGFVAAANDEADAIASFERDPQYHGMVPADFYDENAFTEFNAAYARLIVVSTPVVAESAKALRAAVFGCYFGQEHAWDIYEEALEAFQTQARSMLAEHGDALA